MTNLGYVTGKGVSRVKSNTQVLDYIGRGDRISKKLGGKFLDEGLSGLSITNDNEFCFIWVEFEFHTILSLLNTGKTLSELRKNWNQSSFGQMLDIFRCHQHIDSG